MVNRRACMVARPEDRLIRSLGHDHADRQGNQQTAHQAVIHQGPSHCATFERNSDLKVPDIVMREPSEFSHRGDGRSDKPFI